MSGCSLVVPSSDKFTFDLEDDAGADGAVAADGGADAGFDGGLDAAGLLDAGTDAGFDASLCPISCEGATPYCRGTEMRCVQCLDPSHCDDGVFCTTDRCNLDGTCGSLLDDFCIAELAVGGDHSCVVLANGSVRCWGNNFNGQLGNFADGTFETQAVVVFSLIDAVGVAAHLEHTCAVRSTGAAACWGRDSLGQLGNGSGADSNRPMAVLTISDATAIGAGAVTGHAVRSGGLLRGWGANFFGEVGDGTTMTRQSPVDVTGITDAVSVYGGLFHTCTLRRSGSVACWGQGVGGELGDDASSSSSSPVDVLDISDATQLSVGHSHTCVVHTTGRVSCWGLNNSGQLGDGSTTLSPRPVAVVGVTDATSVSAGASATCAVRTTGEVVCWGDNADGLLGPGFVGTRSDVPVPVAGLDQATAIGVGVAHACARRGADSIYCWGANNLGQLGDEGTTPRAAPMPVTLF